MNKKINNLGRSLIRDHKKKKCFVKDVDGFRHTSDLSDGLDWARLNLRSVTEQNSIDDFIGQAELAETEYAKEFANIKIINPDTIHTPLTENEKEEISAAHETYHSVLSVPRRPLWNASTTKEDLDGMERTAFLNWRRKLAMLSEEKFISLTPYEKNLEVWRQLWRVIEKSEVVVQIIDARNPLLFRSEDLEIYVKEIDESKQNILLLNKADYLSEEQRKYWANYFEEMGISIVFFSAIQQSEKLPEINEDEENSAEEHGSLSDSSASIHEESTKMTDIVETVDDAPAISIKEGSISNSSKIYSREELILFFKSLSKPKEQIGYTTIGLVGYPNVGKSSTINTVMLDKKVQVSSTPGKTKHFQTLMIDSELCLCDCPGLVFPNFVSSKADMIINGILPIDHLTDHRTPVSLIVNLISKDVFESMYSILIQSRSENKESNIITAEELLDAYGYMRGFMTQRGLPDHSRSARYILKDFVNGKLLYCHAPPDVDKYDYNKLQISPVKRPNAVAAQVPKGSKLSETKSEEVDKMFFRKMNSQAHVKGVKPLVGCSDNTLGVNKPWKKHHNKNKKEKLRRIYSATDY